MRNVKYSLLLTVCSVLSMTQIVLAAQGVNGIEKGAQALDSASTAMEAYLDPVTRIIYVIAAIVGVIGAFKIFVNWQGGKDNVLTGAMGWLGSCLFLLIANTIARTMFL